MPSHSHEPAPTRQLSVFDAVCIIVGVVVGSGVYETTPMVARNVPSELWLIGIWTLGGVITLLGALCYAELGAAYPKQGGDYTFLTRAFGRFMGFLFSWAQLWVVRPGSIGAMAYVFARYANALFPLGPHALVIYATLMVAVLTVVNIVGVKQGKWTQNGLTTLKILGLLALSVVGLVFGAENPFRAATADPGNPISLRLALIFVLFTYGGWHEMSFVGEELRDPGKNVLRSLLLGTLLLTLIYVLTNTAFVRALGLVGLRNTTQAAVDVLKLGLGSWGGRLIAALICVSTLGSVNGMIFTGSRIYYAAGTEHRLFSRLGKWSPRFGTPVGSLVLQSGITLALVLGFGIAWGGQEGFGSMVKFSTPVYWLFFLLVCCSLFVLRHKDRAVPRPYRVHGYPVVPLLFCLSSLFVLSSSLTYAISELSVEALWSVGFMIVGIALGIWESVSRGGR